MSGSSDDRFREMFYEEARELLIGLEEGLMDLERRQSDRAHLDKTFRAAHSLKGAAAMVGLASIAEFTHGIEAVLERVRAGLLPVDSEIITTLLEARDHLAAMVEAEAAKSPIPPSGELSQRLVSLLRWQSSPGATGQSGPPPPPMHLTPAVGPPAPNPVSPTIPLPSRQEPVPGPGDAKAEPAPKDLSSAEKPPKSKSSSRKTVGTAGSEPGAKDPTPRRKIQKRGLSSAQPPNSGSGKAGEGPEFPDVTVYQIGLAPGPEILRRGINPVGLLDELRDLGEATITTNAELVPPLDVIDPERCYLTWTITLKTGAEPDRIEDAFMFFAEDSIITIERLTSDGKLVPVKPAESKPARDRYRQRTRSIGGTDCGTVEFDGQSARDCGYNRVAFADAREWGGGSPRATDAGSRPVPPKRAVVREAPDCATAHPHSGRRRATR